MEIVWYSTELTLAWKVDDLALLADRKIQDLEVEDTKWLWEWVSDALFLKIWWI